MRAGRLTDYGHLIAEQHVRGSELPPDPIDQNSVGADIRALRKVRGLTLTGLAKKIGRSVGYMSQVERGISIPPMEDLRALSRALEVPLGWFFAQESVHRSDRGYVVRSGARRRLGSQTEGLTEELLSPDLGGSFELVLSEFAPGAESGKPIQRGVEEAGYVIEGCLEVTVGERTFLLQANDSFRFTDEPMSWRNPGPKIARLVWVIAPPIY